LAFPTNGNARLNCPAFWGKRKKKEKKRSLARGFQVNLKASNLLYRETDGKSSKLTLNYYENAFSKCVLISNVAQRKM
jgi:hypothetical protein